MKRYNREMGMLMISNGRTMWSYNEKKNEVFVMELNQPKDNPDYGKLVKDMLKSTLNFWAARRCWTEIATF